MHQLVPREWGAGADRDRKTEPARLGSGGGPRQDQVFFQIAEAVVEGREIAPTGGDEIGQFLQLGNADGRLHVGGLQVVTDVRVGVFVVVATGELTELPAEPL